MTDLQDVSGTKPAVFEINAALDACHHAKGLMVLGRPGARRALEFAIGSLVRAILKLGDAPC